MWKGLRKGFQCTHMVKPNDFCTDQGLTAFSTECKTVNSFFLPQALSGPDYQVSLQTGLPWAMRICNPKKGLWGSSRSWRETEPGVGPHSFPTTHSLPLRISSRILEPEASVQVACPFSQFPTCTGRRCQEPPQATVQAPRPHLSLPPGQLCFHRFRPFTLLSFPWINGFYGYQKKVCKPEISPTPYYLGVKTGSESFPLSCFIPLLLSLLPLLRSLFYFLRDPLAFGLLVTDTEFHMRISPPKPVEFSLWNLLMLPHNLLKNAKLW